MLEDASRLQRKQRGVTAIEYAIIAGVIVSGLVIVVGALGAAVLAMYARVVAAFG